MEQKKQTTKNYREVQIGSTLYRVTSIFKGEKDFGKTLEEAAVRKAMMDFSKKSATT